MQLHVRSQCERIEEDVVRTCSRCSVKIEPGHGLCLFGAAHEGKLYCGRDCATAAFATAAGAQRGGEWEAFVTEHIEWARATFPGERTAAAARHLMREAREVLRAISIGDTAESVAEECADTMMLALYIVDRLGLNPLVALRLKLAKNKARKWAEPDRDGVVEHERAADAHPEPERCDESGCQRIAAAAAHAAAWAPWHASRDAGASPEEARPHVPANAHVVGDALTKAEADCKPADWRARARAAERDLAEARLHIDEADHLRERMDELLTKTAAALKGEPAELTMHDWSDLPAVAARMVTREADAIAREEAAAKMLSASEDERERLSSRVRELLATINAPEIIHFAHAVEIEAAHQRERWGSDHDVGKTDADWLWLIGFLASKALHNPGGSEEKRLHRIVTVAAAACNWHASRLGKTNMRPGIDPPREVAAEEARSP